MTDTTLIELSPSGVAVWVDTPAVAEIQKQKWTLIEASSFRQQWYAQALVNGMLGDHRICKQMGMGRLVLLLWDPGLWNTWRDWVADHVNGDGLDNRVCNLRPVSRSKNARNIHRDKPRLVYGERPPGIPVVPHLNPPQRTKATPIRCYAPVLSGLPCGAPA